LSATAIRYAALLLEPLRISRNVGRPGDGGVISGAIGASYTPVDADQGHTLTVKVAFSDAAGNAETGSAMVAVTPFPPFHQNEHEHHDNNEGNGNDHDHSHDFSGMVTNFHGDDSAGPFTAHGPTVSVVHVDVEATLLTDGTIDFQLPLIALDAPLVGDIVSITATLPDGKPLPSWLSFNTETGKFAGQVPDDIMTASIPGGAGGGQADALTKITIQVTAMDSKGDISLVTFTIDLAAPAQPGKGGHLDPWGPGEFKRHALAPYGDLVLPVDAAAWQHALRHGGLGPDGSHDLRTDHGPAGRVGLSDQLKTIGWRGLHADRMALLASLRQGAAGAH